MHIKQKILLWFFIIILLPIIFFTLGTVGFWNQLDSTEQSFIVELIRKYAAYIYISISLYMFLMVYIAKWLFFSYFIPLKKLTEDTSIRVQSFSHNPIKTKGGKELQNLVKMINRLAHKNSDSSNDEQNLKDRPEFFEFDLFKHGSGFDDMECLSLSDLKYVIFDTETTGIFPDQGDEIISLGAVYLISNKILWNSQFNVLVNPQKTLSTESEKITGITQEILKNKPLLEEVLPDFHSFCRDSVLVGHNVAFDMRFIELKQEKVNLKFDNPVLDTLLLSAVVHPFQDSHSLEAIAERYGIPITNRHTALGDAIITAEVFIKLLSVLEEKGIKTLKQAMDVSQKTYYARIKY